MCGLGVAVGCRMKHAKSAFEGFPKALGEGCQVSVVRVLRFVRVWSVGLGGGLPSQRFKGFKLFKGLERLEGLEGLEGLRAGRRQAWTPIRSH